MSCQQNKFKAEFPLIETIAIHHGVAQNLAYHQQRYERGVEYLARMRNEAQLIHLFQDELSVPEAYQNGIVRCRVAYNAQQIQWSFFSYQARQVRSFKLVYADDLDYGYKYSDRTELDQLFLQRGQCDEIIIVKNQLITDTSIANLLFYKRGVWYTPADPLLAGTQREKLLAEQKITPVDISVSDLQCFEKVMWINSLNEFNESRAISLNLNCIAY